VKVGLIVSLKVKSNGILYIDQLENEMESYE
jgi:hypothetical protein